ncbi:MAG TPA: lipoyl(octanoyl) transferase LipB [Planctomycetota bacterium]|nr:lipoyl(octanoyl) transferase LipB [Planctomycetota bacterium]
MKRWGDFRVIRPGRVAFDEAWDLQRKLADEVRAGGLPALILLEHPPVFTLGKNADLANLLNAGDIPVRRIDRGGDVTWHGPGQLVAYPILSLRERKLGVRGHVEALERTIVEVAATYGVQAAPKPGCVGVWTAKGKIASIGIRVASGVTQHGAALNVDPDLASFARINPCGVKGGAVTSIAAEAGRRITVDEAAERFIPHFTAAFRFAGPEARTPARA